MARLVLYGIGGIGKSTLAAQITARLARLQPDQVIATITGEVSPAAFPAGPHKADMIVLDDFDDNLTREPSEPSEPGEPGEPGEPRKPGEHGKRDG